MWYLAASMCPQLPVGLCCEQLMWFPAGQRTLQHSGDVLDTQVVVNPAHDFVCSEVRTVATKERNQTSCSLTDWKHFLVPQSTGTFIICGTDSDSSGDHVFESIKSCWAAALLCWPEAKPSAELIWSDCCSSPLYCVNKQCVSCLCAQVRRLVCDSSRHKLLVLAGQCVEESGDIVLQKGCFSLNHFIHIFADEEVRKFVRLTVKGVNVQQHT